MTTSHLDVVVGVCRRNLMVSLKKKNVIKEEIVTKIANETRYSQKRGIKYD